MMVGLVLALALALVLRREIGRWRFRQSGLGKSRPRELVLASDLGVLAFSVCTFDLIVRWSSARSSRSLASKVAIWRSRDWMWVS